MRRMFFVAALAVLSLAAVAAGQWIDIEQRLTPEQRHATGLDTLSAEQLALLNRLLRAQPDMPPGPAARGEAAPGTDERARTSRFLGFDDTTITSTVVGTLDGWEPGTEITLANGQRWKVLKGAHRLPRALQSPQVRIVPGAAGRWFLKVDEDTPGARVYRID